MWAGMFHGAMQIVTGGRGLFDRRENQADHAYVLKIEDYKKRFGRPPQKVSVKLDNEYTYDKLTDVYKSG